MQNVHLGFYKTYGITLNAASGMLCQSRQHYKVFQSDFFFEYACLGLFFFLKSDSLQGLPSVLH